MKRTKEQAAVTYNRLLDAALTVFSAKGYASTTLEDIAKEAETTRGAIYWHFKNKADLYNALFREISVQSGTIATQAIAEGGSCRETMGRIMLRLLAQIERDDRLCSIMEIKLFKTGVAPELMEEVQRQREEGHLLLENIARYVQQGIAVGDIRPDVEAVEVARAFLAMLNGLTTLWLYDSRAFALSANAQTLADIFVRGVEPPH